MLHDEENCMRLIAKIDSSDMQHDKASTCNSGTGSAVGNVFLQQMRV